MNSTVYVPKSFEVSDANAARELVRTHPFATLVTMDRESGAPFAGHVPLLLDGDDLVGHLARGNPQWRQLQSGEPVTAIFHGPHTYVTPSWYSGGGVPTWNYAVVHARGRARLVEDFRGLIRILGALTERFEGAEPSPWRFTLPEDLRSEENLTGAIVGFRIEKPVLEAKFKLSQNRSPEDHEGVLAGLATRADEQSRSVRELMLKQRS
jgi:transcriptional regulator